jgi:hypothetical protein
VIFVHVWWLALKQKAVSVRVLFRVTRLANFWPIARLFMFSFLFTLGSFFSKLTEIYYGYFFQTLHFACINFDKIWIGLHFGQMFHKLIWSPWSYYFEWFQKNGKVWAKNCLSISVGLLCHVCTLCLHPGINFMNLIFGRNFFDKLLDNFFW